MYQKWTSAHLAQQMSSYVFILSECKHFVASSKTKCKIFFVQSVYMYLVISQCFTCVWFVSLALLFRKSFALTFQTFPCLVKLFVIINAHSIHVFAYFFCSGFCSSLFVLLFLDVLFSGFTEAISLFELLVIASGL